MMSTCCFYNSIISYSGLVSRVSTSFLLSSEWLSSTIAPSNLSWQQLYWFQILAPVIEYVPSKLTFQQGQVSFYVAVALTVSVLRFRSPLIVTRVEICINPQSKSDDGAAGSPRAMQLSFYRYLLNHLETDSLIYHLKRLTEHLTYSSLYHLEY